MGKLKVFKDYPATKSLEERVAESCCSFHVGLEGVYDSSKPIKFIMSKNGVMKVVQNAVGLFVVEAGDVPGLPDIAEGLLLNIPKIPYHLLLQTITFFKAVMEKYNNSEAMVQFYYDKENSSYIMHCPEQEVSGASVKFKRNATMDDTYTLVMDIHSHNTMSAHFSSIDDADEKETRIFGVIGKLKDESPEMKFRISVGGDFKEIGVFDIFEHPFPSTSFPQEWLNTCVKRPACSVYDRNKYNRTAGFSTSPYHTFYDEYEDLNYLYDKDSGTYRGSKTTASSSYSKDTFADVISMRQEDLIDLTKDILVSDIEAVALAILDERMEDDIINYLHKHTLNTMYNENDL